MPPEGETQGHESRGFHAPILNHDGVAIPRGQYLDVNGDGLLDLVYSEGREVYVRYGERREEGAGSGDIPLVGVGYVAEDGAF